MILGDIFSRVAFVAADEIGIPGIVINALPWTFCIKLGFLENPSLKRDGKNCFGCICIFRPFISAVSRSYLPYYMKNHPDTAKSILAHGHRTIICASFFGLEPAESVPPNVVFTGPFMDPPTNLLPILKLKDEKLYDWLEKAVEDK